MHYPMVLAAAVKFDHGDQQDNNGKISHFKWDNSVKKLDTIDLETVVEVRLEVFHNLLIDCKPTGNKYILHCGGE